MASHQWPGGSYAADAKEIIGDIFATSIGGDGMLRPGDGWGTADVDYFPDYFSPAYYRVFAQVTGRTEWSRNHRRAGLHHPCGRDRAERPGARPDQRVGRRLHRGRPLHARQRQRDRVRELHVRRLPHPVAHRDGLLLQRRAASHGVPGQGGRLLQQPRRGEHQGWLYAKRRLRRQRQPEHGLHRHSRDCGHGRQFSHPPGGRIHLRRPPIDRAITSRTRCGSSRC